MKKIMIAGTSILALGFAHAASAPAKGPTTRGPYSDTHIVLPLDFTDFGYHTYLGTAHPDFIMVNPCPHCEFSRQIRGVGYETSPNGNFEKGDVILTTLYGNDLNPGGEDLLLTGYTASAPEATFYGEEFIGKSRKIYRASTSEVVAIGDLPARLGKGFDLSPFKGDPSTVVYLFQTTVPVKDNGTPVTGVVLAEDFSGAFHVGYGDAGGAFGLGDIAGTLLTVTDGNIDILGVQNGQPNGMCQSNPSGNCLDLIGNMGHGEVHSLLNYSLDPKNTYTIEFTVDTGDLGGSATLDLQASLGSFAQKVTATSTSQTFDLFYTPPAAEPAVTLGFMSLTKVDETHGPVLSAIKLCVHKAGTKNLRCSTK